jgi:hypothetical protein
MNAGGVEPQVIPQARSRLPGRLIIGVVSALMLFVTATHLMPAIRAGLRDGSRGHWVATAKHCSRSICNWSGRFVSPNGHVLLTSAQYAGRLPAGVHAGTSIAGLYPGGSELVYPTTGSDEWISLLVLLILAVGGLYWSSHRLVAKYFRDRAATTAS